MKIPFVPKILINITSIILICAVLGCTFASCNSQKSAVNGLVTQIKPEKTIGRLIPTAVSFNVKTRSASDKNAVAKAVAIYPETKFTVDGAGNDYKISFASTLLANTVYKLCSQTGGRTVYSWAFQTTADFSVDSVSLPQKITDKSISFNFTYNDVENFEQNFSISPAVNGSFSQEGKKWSFTATNGFLPETTYTVTLKKDVSAKNGLTLTEDYVSTFTTDAASGNYASLVRDGKDYANSYLPGDTPRVLVKYKGLKSRDVKASVYKFSDYKAYINAHKTYFKAPDLSDVDTLVSGLTKQSDFETTLDNYPSYSNNYTTSDTADKGLIVYPSAYFSGYYLTVITIGQYKLYHVFQVSALQTYSVTAGNSINVWVINSKTGKPLTDSEVILDNAYDEKTNENGVAAFTIKDDKVNARYIMISDPDNENVPFISYLPVNQNYAEINTANSYNCAVYTDSDSYQSKDTVHIFGIAAPVNKAAAAKNVKLKYYYAENGENAREIAVTPDSNGAFSAEIQLTGLSGEQGNKLYIELYVNEIKTEAVSVNVGGNYNSKLKTVKDNFFTATLQNNVLSVKSTAISSTVTNGCSFNQSASEKYGTAVFDSNAVDMDFTVKVYKRTAFKKTESGKYYDAVTQSLQKKYVYKRVNSDEKVSEISSKTKNGSANITLNYQNDSANGIYYFYRVSYKNKAGKTVYFDTDNYKSTDSFFVADNTSYTLSFDKTENVKSGDVLSGTVAKGTDAVNSGKVLLVTSYYNAKSNKLLDADKISLDITENEIPLAEICGAYYDGKHIYILNRNSIKYDQSSLAPNITITADKTSYAKGDTVTLTVNAKDMSGKGVSVPVLVNVYNAAKYRFNTTDEFTLGSRQNLSKFVFEQSSAYNYGIKNKSDYNDRQSSDKMYDIQQTESVKNPYFDYVTTDSSGNAQISFTVRDENISYACTALAFSEFSYGRADTVIKTDSKAQLEVSAKEQITISDEFSLDIKSNIAQTAEKATVEKTAATTAKANGTVKASETTVAARENEQQKYTVKATLYNDVKGKENEFDEKNKLQNLTQAENITNDCSLGFGKLSIGKYIYKVECGYNGNVRTVIGHLTVTADNTVTVPITGQIDKNGVGLPYSSSTAVTAVLYDESYRELFELAVSLCNYKAGNLPQLLGYIDAQKFFGSQNIDFSKLSAYQPDGISYEENSAADLILTAASAAVCPDYFDKDKLIEYFTKYTSSKKDTEQMIAYFGLASLGRPVLEKLYSFNDDAKLLSAEQKLYLALGFASIGCFDEAVKIYNELVGEIKNEETLAVELDDMDKATSVTLVCLLGCKINDSRADAMISHIRQNEDGKNKYKLSYLCYAEYVNDFVSVNNGKITVTAKINDESRNITFDKSGFSRLDIKPTKLKTATLSSSNAAYYCAVYMLSKEEAEKLG